MLSRLGGHNSFVPTTRSPAENQRLNGMTKRTITSIRPRPPAVVMVWRTSIEGIDLGQRERPSCPMSGMGQTQTWADSFGDVGLASDSGQSSTRPELNRQLPAVALHRTSRHQRPAVDQHKENQLERQCLVRVCFGVHCGLNSYIAPSPKSTNNGNDQDHSITSSATRARFRGRSLNACGYQRPPRRISLTITSSSTAPMVAAIISATSPAPR
jgi:hypothetical protein